MKPFSKCPFINSRNPNREKKRGEEGGGKEKGRNANNWNRIKWANWRGLHPFNQLKTRLHFVSLHPFFGYLSFFFFSALPMRNWWLHIGTWCQSIGFYKDAIHLSNQATHVIYHISSIRCLNTIKVHCPTHHPSPINTSFSRRGKHSIYYYHHQPTFDYCSGPVLNPVHLVPTFFFSNTSFPTEDPRPWHCTIETWPGGRLFTRFVHDDANRSFYDWNLPLSVPTTLPTSSASIVIYTVDTFMWKTAAAQLLLFLHFSVGFHHWFMIIRFGHCRFVPDE